MGLAVYNSITLDIRFPPCCYKKLLSPPIVPSDQNTPVGICSVTTDDLCQIMPELAHGLSELLSYEGNVEEDFYSTFQVLLRAKSFLLTMYFMYENAICY